MTTRSGLFREPAVLYRSGITAADVLGSVTIGTGDLVANDAITGVMAASEHKLVVVPGNRWGFGLKNTAATVTPTLNKTVDLKIDPAVTGAEWYDIFFSTDTAPLRLARVTAAQAAAGCAITAVDTVEARDAEETNYAEGVINIRLVGTGMASSATPSANSGYLPNSAAIPSIDCSGNEFLHLLVKASIASLEATPVLVLCPFFKNEVDTDEWHQGDLITFTSITAASPGSLSMAKVINVYGCKEVKVLVVNSTAGSSYSIDLWAARV